jgi:hypothetical protein
VTGQARRAGVGATIAYAPAATPAGIDAFTEVHSRSLKRVGVNLIARGAGRVAGTFPISRTASYSIWQGGSFGRPVIIAIDGERVATIRYQESYPAEYVRLGVRRLSAGAHILTMVRGGGSAHPGSGDGVDGFTRTIGPTLFRPLDQPPTRVGFSSVGGFDSLCRGAQPWDWVEILRG